MTGDFTAINVEEGVTVELLDFYNPGRGTPAYIKLYRKKIGLRYGRTNRTSYTNMEPNTII